LTLANKRSSPAEFAFSASVLTGTKEPQAGKAFIEFLSKPPAARFIKAKGMEPG
jgi:hypothetical protein